MEKFKPALNQESQEETSTPEQQARETINKTQYALESIDQNVLRDIFFEMLSPAEAEDAWNGFLPTSSVHVVYDEKIRSRGLFYSKANNVEEAYIILNAEKIVKAKEQDFQLAVLYAYVHEQVHALSTDLKTHTSYDNNPDLKFIGFKGIKKYFPGPEVSVSYVELNEGMTEIIAEEVAHEYLRRTGQVAGEQRESHHTDDSEIAYAEYKMLVEDIITDLAAEYSQPNDVIKKALIRAYFSKKTPEDNFTDWLEKTHASLAERATNVVQGK